MNTIGTRVTSSVIESVGDEKTVITTCSAKTVKWSNVSQRSMAARRPNGQNLFGSIEAFVRDQGRLLPTLLRVSVNDVVELARSEIRPRIVQDLSDEELIQRISSAARDASRALQVVPDEIPIVAGGAGSGVDSGISSASNVSQRSTAARSPNDQNLYRSVDAFVRDEGRRSLGLLLQFTVNHARLVELARSLIRRSIVENLSDEELIQRISAALRDASRVVPEAIPIVARAGSGGDSSISSLSMHQAEGNYAVELAKRSIATIPVDPAAQPADDDVIAGRLNLAAEIVSTSSSRRALSTHQPQQNEDHDDERKQPAQKKPRIGE